MSLKSRNGTEKTSAKLVIGFAISIVRVTDGTENAAPIPMKRNVFVRFQLPRTIVRITSKRKGIGIGMVGKSLNKPKSLESEVMNCAD
jgi:hypothetical protein